MTRTVFVPWSRMNKGNVVIFILRGNVVKFGVNLKFFSADKLSGRSARSEISHLFIFKVMNDPC